MLLLGRFGNLATTDKTKILNFNSFNEKYPRLHLLPPYSLGAKSEYDFDVKYAQWIMNDKDAFIDFMQIIYPLYQGYDVFLLVDDGPVMEMLVESLQKFIQQRYGYNSAYITCMDDLLNAEDGDFSELGTLNLQADKERLSYMLESSRLRNGGYVYGEY
jgi:hypothetical protein